MKKVINWTFGGFFRTIGRTLAFLLIGTILGYIAFKSGIKITDIFGIMSVKAATSTAWTTKQSRLYLDDHGTETNTSWQTIPYTESPSLPVAQMQYRLRYSGGLDPDNTYRFKISYLAIPDTLNVSEVWFHDGTYRLDDSSSCQGWYRENNDYYANICTVQPQTSISSSGYLYVRIVFNQAYVSSIRSYVGNFEERTGIESVVTQQTEIINNSITDVNDSINDDNVSGANEKAKELFTNFTTNNHGLTGVITAPLDLIRNLASNTCNQLVLPLPFVNENLTLPCLSSIYQQYFPSFLTIYQVVVSALVGYKICISIFFMVKGFKDPGEDKIEVLDL